MPAYYLYVVCVTLAMWFAPSSQLSTNGAWTPRELTLSLWAYFVNFAPMGGIWNGQGATIHLWSLAVEEQYYLFWPVSLFLILKYSSHRRIIAWSLYGAVLIYFLGFASVEERGAMLYARGVSLFLASAVAVTIHPSSGGGLRQALAARAGRWLGIAALSTLAAYVLAAAHVMSEVQIRHYLLPLLLPFYVGAIASLWYGSVTGAWRWVLGRPALIYIGKISYGVYLYHEVARIVVWWATAGLLTRLPRALAYGVRLAMFFGLTLIVATLSYRLLEQPFLRLKHRFRPKDAPAGQVATRGAVEPAG
jgi:peptidoglycan/LPS O-acetylase OafA/YrhL